MGIEYAPYINASCSINEYTVGGSIQFDTNTQVTTFCLCACTGGCGGNGTCSLTGCDVDIAKVTAVGADGSCELSAGTGSQVLCDGDCGTGQVTIADTLDPTLQAAMLANDLELILEIEPAESLPGSRLGLTGKPTGQVPAASEWGIVLLVLLTAIAGTIMIGGQRVADRAA
jgi:hypothetical protein